MSLGGLKFLDAATVRAKLTHEAARPVVREAMIALSDGRVRQLLRSFIGLGEGRTFAIMPAALSERGAFGAKLVSVFATGPGRKAHEGVVILFDGDSGAPVCLADAGEVTAIRTAAASAVATDALARPQSSVMTVLGSGRQAQEHVRAIAAVRPLREVRIWGRDPAIAAQVAARLAREVGVPCAAEPQAERAVRGADIVCATTAATDPVLAGAWVSPGTHVNLVGSSGPGQAEADADLVALSRFVVDHREHVLVHGGEFLRAKAAGRIGQDHIVGEIGEVLAGRIGGRRSADEVTVYKSLGHAAQDLAVVQWLFETD